MKRLLLLLLLAVVSLALASDDECTSEDITRFTRWLESHGAEISPKLEWPETSTKLLLRPRGVFAKHDIDKNETLVSIPAHLHLTADQEYVNTNFAVQLSQVRNLLDSNDDDAFAKFHMDHITLTLQLMRETTLNKDSFFFEYLQVLPRELVLVHELTSKDLKALGHVASIDSTVQFHNKLEKLFSVLFPSSPTSEMHEQFMWANGIVRSRAVRNAEGELALIPFVDMFNTGGINAINAQVDQAKVVAKTREISAGDEVLVFYGPYSNLFLMLHYGFVLPEYNTFDGLAANLPQLSKQDPLFTRKQAELNRIKVLPVIIPANSAPMQLITFFRVVMAGARDFKEDMSRSDPALEEVALAACVRQIDNELTVFTDGTEGNAVVLVYRDTQRTLLQRGRTFCNHMLQTVHNFTDQLATETDKAFQRRFHEEMANAAIAVIKQEYGVERDEK